MGTHEAIVALQKRLNEAIVGQNILTERLLIGLLSDGHVLVEGAPGLAKTRAVKTLAQCLEGSFARIQFTPDLLPADIIGTDVYAQDEGVFRFSKGPLFHNIVLADEVNRAPAKVQSALLEAMEERHISVGGTTRQLGALFFVMATQNPIEQEGTYPLPEAQLDRFLLHVTVDYPDADAEARILRVVREETKARHDGAAAQSTTSLVTQAQLFAARKDVLSVYMSDAVESYVVRLILATRNPATYDKETAALIEFGASPRATIALDRASRAHAWLQGNDFVSPDDVKAVFHDVLRHRILLRYAAEAEGASKNDVCDRLLHFVSAP